jgi:hypothetical protein
MEKLKKTMQDNPQLKSERQEFLKLAVKNEKGAVIGTGPHHLRVIDCENATNKDYQTQKEVKGVNLILEEGGEQKKYFIPTIGADGKFHYLFERFAGIQEGSEIVMEYKRKPGSARGFIDVRLAGGDDTPGADGDPYDDIPIVEENEHEADPENDSTI